VQYYAATPIFLVALARMPERSRHFAAIPNWQKQDSIWQQPILDREDAGSRWRCLMSFDLTGGGTLWSAADARFSRSVCRLECIDYRWYESLDVRLYGSFAY